MDGRSLEIQLLVVLADAAGLGGEGVEHHGGVDEVLLHALQPGVQLLEPHELGRVCGARGAGGRDDDTTLETFVDEVYPARV